MFFTLLFCFVSEGKYQLKLLLHYTNVFHSNFQKELNVQSIDKILQLLITSCPILQSCVTFISKTFFKFVKSFN